MVSVSDALHRPRQQDDAGEHGQRRRNQRPPEARHLPRPEGHASPAMPLIRNIQPRKMVTARLASGGTIIAASPSTTSRMPSNRKAFQCALHRGAHFGLQFGDVVGKGHGERSSEFSRYARSDTRAFWRDAETGSCSENASIKIASACASPGRARTKSPPASSASGCGREYRPPWWPPAARCRSGWR